MLYFRKARTGDKFQGFIKKGRLKDGRRDLVMLAFEDDRLIGACSMQTEDMEGEINSIYVTPENRREGIGEGLIKSTINAALRIGITRVQVPNAGKLVAFFEKMGFSREGANGEVLAVELENYFKQCCQNNSFQG